MDKRAQVKNENDAGLISRTLEDFFISVNEDTEIKIEISFIEIYNEKVFDLLESKKKKGPLPIKGFTVQGFTKVSVYNTYEALQYLKEGSRQRHTGETKQNRNSSRSHAIFSIHCRVCDSETNTVAKFNLVDLAGSESVRKTGNQGSSLYEGININKGLLSLGQVMTALSTHSGHIPYRQSVITTILQDSLNKRNFISLIACVSSNPEDLGETLQTLEFSNRVKKMRNKPEVNEFILQYKKDNPTIFMNNGPKMQTPLKRSNGLLYETPFKRPRNVPLIEESVNLTENNSNFNISPLFSSSVSSAISDSRQNFSPVIRKYINQMENSLFSKLQDVITSTIKRPSYTKFPKENKENELSFSKAWNGIDKISPNNIHDEVHPVTSSPDTAVINDSVVSRNNLHVMKLRRSNRRLNDSGLLYNDDSQLDTEDNTVFKVPTSVLKTKTTNNSKRKTSVRLLTKMNTDLENTIRRRSIRIQNQNNNVTQTEADSTIQSITRRRSVRLQIKSNREDENVRDVNEEPTEKSKIDVGCVCTCKNASSKSRRAQDSPTTARHKHVLNILNEGNLRQIEKLHTVGTKTAEKILMFRELKGEFKSISDLKKMPNWTQRKYDKFLDENFLRN